MLFLFHLSCRLQVKCTHKTGQMKQCQTQRMDRLKNAEPKYRTKGCAISVELWYYDFNFQEVCIMAAKSLLQKMSKSY